MSGFFSFVAVREFKCRILRCIQNDSKGRYKRRFPSGMTNKKGYGYLGLALSGLAV
jgi:hypothetical protein